MFRVSELEILSEMDVSVILPVIKLSKKVKNWIQKDEFIRRGNLVELVIVTNTSNLHKAENCINNSFPANISLVHIDSNSIHEYYSVGVHHASFNNILFVKDDIFESNESLVYLLKLKRYYKDSYVFSANPNCILATKYALQQIECKYHKPLRVDLYFNLIRLLLGKINLIEVNANEKALKTFPACPSRQLFDSIQLNVSQTIRPSQRIYWKKDKGPDIIKHNRKFSKLETLSLRGEETMNIICLLQVRNEEYYIVDALRHFEQYFDGIILLDDGSCDKTYEIAESPKLLCKAKKMNVSNEFNDLENRNMLLELAYYYKSEWLIFLDADERFHESFDRIEDVARTSNANVLEFKCVHLWDSSKMFRVDIPEGTNGIMSRCRMFRHKGWMQIYANREIYFTAVPFLKNTQSVPILILHYGLMNRSVRERKYFLYNKQDNDGRKQGYDYEYLLNETPVLRDIESIQLFANSAP